MRRAILRSSRLALGATGCAAAAGVLSINSSKGLAAAEPASAKDLDVDGVGGRVYSALINRKVNACPMAIRVAWHASGTYDAAAETGGSDGATMRFEPERSDGANAGLFIIHDLLLQVKSALGSALSLADLWTLAGCKAVEFLGGPRVPFAFGRKDASPESARVPPNGLLPDASQGAEHLRDVFHRMGFDDRDIVALSGAHTVGRCHKVRSGFDGPWTTNPLKFDNEYFRNLMNLEWVPRKWDGPLQYTDAKTETLIMLPTDMALKTDPVFAPIAREYANDQSAFFRDFSSAFSRLVAKGAPAACQPKPLSKCPKAAAAAELRDWAMHGSLEHINRLLAKHGNGTPVDGLAYVDVDAKEADTGRTAMHKAAFWGHAHVIAFLANTCLANVSPEDFAGDTPLHDAARFGHARIVRALLDVGANCSSKNRAGETPLALAVKHDKADVIALLTEHSQAELTNAAKARRESFLLAGASVPLKKEKKK